MHILESLWIRDRLSRIPDVDLFPVVDVGSSTLEYRTRTQPWIDENLFAPLRARGGGVIYIDAKQEPGVDVVVNLLDARSRARIRTLGARTALICNILHHLTDRGPIARGLVETLPVGGHIVASGPFQYAPNYDPVETMYRPRPEAAAQEFPGTQLVDSAIIDSGNWRQWHPGERGGRSLLRFLTRMCAPCYRPAEWLRLLPHVPYLFRHMKAYVILLKKVA